tara:strand:- start:1467 stop:1727 length:261 start_codon:yes stop_codon:yes gene_type:complete
MDDEVITCPLGSTCYEIKDNKPHRCAWHVKMKGIDASGEEHDEWGCAISWQPILMTEVAKAGRGNTAATESFRNEMVKANDLVLLK